MAMQEFQAGGARHQAVAGRIAKKTAPISNRLSCRSKVCHSPRDPLLFQGRGCSGSAGAAVLVRCETVKRLTVNLAVSP